ncbi:MAG TPA: extracellular solute-binding protein [Gammaproteobacteria bacterium]|nr:extracellular solute-binding protein [Gammaproteobacteria bacterium]
MKKAYALCAMAIMALLFLMACSEEQDADVVDNHKTVFVEQPPAYPVEPLPEGLIWETNNDDPVFSSPDAKKGGTLRSFVYSFPLTLRSSGPDAGGIFANYVNDSAMGLVAIHPETANFIPSLATHWAYGKDGLTVYYKLDPNAKWSDGLPVTADDYLFTNEFSRSKFIVDPVTNNYYEENIASVKKYDDYTISITGTSKKPRSDMLYYYSFGPTPWHFHKLDENWVRDYNWRVEPNVGPYQITKVKKGKYVEFTRKQDWWAKDYKYYKNRYNVDVIHVQVIRELQIAFQHFLKGELDEYWMPWPDYWHEKATGSDYDAGYIHKIQFYNDTPQRIQGYFLNTDYELFRDINVRCGFEHSLNIQKIIDELLRGDYERQHTIFKGYGDYTNNQIRAREYDLGKADEFFKKAGWIERGPDGIRVKDGKRLSVTIDYGQDNLTERFVLLREEAKKAGVEINLSLKDSEALHKLYRDKKHQVAYMALGPTFRPEFWSLFHSDNAHIPNTNNYSNVADPALDDLIDRYRFGTEEEERKRLARETAAKIHDLCIYTPDYYVPYTRYSYWRWLKLPDFHGPKMAEYLFPYGDFGLFWIDEEEKERTLAARKAGEKFEPVTIIDTRYRVK